MGYMCGMENCGMWLTCKGSFFSLFSFRENGTARNLKVQKKKSPCFCSNRAIPNLKEPLIGMVMKFMECWIFFSKLSFPQGLCQSWI